MIPDSSRIHRWQKRTGTLAAFFFFAALLSLADSLIGGISGNRGIIELLPGSTYAISGPMPPKTETIAEIRIEGLPEDGSVQLVPRGVFSGFWFGGAMWRGAVEVAPTARAAEYTALVKDPFGEKQNPALVFKIRIWPDQQTLNAHSSSFLTRQTGQNPFLFVGIFALCGLFTGLATFLLGRRWAKLLGEHGCSEIYKLTTSEQGTEITCDLPATESAALLAVGRQCPVFRASGESLHNATIVALHKKDVILLIAEENAVRIGDVVCLLSQPQQIPAAA